jgi:trimeric autotransporter adhesin
MNPLTSITKTTLPLILAIVLGCFGLSPQTQAVSPAPDGCYSNFTTAEGCNALQSLSTGAGNTGLGSYALFANATGNYNTAVGAGALDLNTATSNTAVGAVALLLNTGGTQNTATGVDALLLNTTGSDNTGIGAFALSSNTTGGGNIALGSQAGSSLTTGNNNIDIGNIGVAAESNTIRIGDPAIHAGVFLAGITAMSAAAPNQAVLVDPATGQLGSADTSSFGVVSTDPENTAVGDQALQNLDGGGYNDAVGAFSLFSNIDGSFNNAFGDGALSSNIHASENTAIGDLALANNDSTGNGKAQFNTAVGARALFTNIDGEANNAVGDSALFSNTTGTQNTAVGDVALENNVDGSANVVVGAAALVQNVHGVYNTVIGYFAGASVEGNDNIYIGATSADGVTSESSTIRIGDPSFVTGCYVAGISGRIASGGVQVFITGDGKLGTLTSSARFKDDIKPMANASESILALKPVTFRYKKEVDANNIPQFGLIAEDVEKVNPDLVVRDNEGKPYSVRYEQVNAMLLNEFLKEHRKVEEQESRIEQQEAKIAHQQKQIDALTAGLQKVSARIELSNAAPQMVLNNQ